MKRLFIIRGLPGSGKTTLARLLVPENSIAADDFMVDSCGVYLHDPKRLKDCHANCLSVAKTWMANGVENIAVHNTFSMRWEMAPYIDAAKSCGYEIFTIEAQNDFGSIHGVPQGHRGKNEGKMGMKNDCNMCGNKERLRGEYFCKQCAQEYVVPYISSQDRSIATFDADERFGRSSASTGTRDDD